MPQPQRSPPIDAAGVDAAIAQVLQAESEARAGLQRCAEEAEALVAAAQLRARQIARRAAHRSVRVQRWYAAMLQQSLAAIARQQAAAMHVATAAEPVPPEVIETLAAQLTGPA